MRSKVWEGGNQVVLGGQGEDDCAIVWNLVGWREGEGVGGIYLFPPFFVEVQGLYQKVVSVHVPEPTVVNHSRVLVDRLHHGKLVDSGGGVGACVGLEPRPSQVGDSDVGFWEV